MSLTKTVKATALSLGIGVSLAGTQAAQAQAISIKFVGGGSSALQGDYRFNASFLTINGTLTAAQVAPAGAFTASGSGGTFGGAVKPFGGSGLQGNQFSEGALPQAVELIGAIGTYKPGVQAERVIVLRSFNQQGDGTAITPGNYPATPYTYTSPTVGTFKRYVLTAAQAAQPNTILVSPDDIVVQTNPSVASTSPAARFEVVGDAEIRTTIVGSATNVAILLRSDSGQGVRYAANGAKIVQLPATVSGAAARFARVLPDPSGGPIIGPTFNAVTDSADIAVINNLTAAASSGGIAISAGLSDVTADSVIRYAGFGAGSFGQNYTGQPVFNAINNPPNAFTAKPVAVQTLLALYNANINAPNDFTVVIPHHIAQNITLGFQGATAGSPIQWSNVDGRLPANFVKNAFRENTSGTRLTYLVDILRHSLVSGDYNSENIGGKTLAPTTNPQLGTGTMLGTVNSSADSYGYSFVTGGAGNGRGAIRVAAYEGVLPYKKASAALPGDISGGSTSLPGNNGQAGYSTSPYYTETINGRYPLWSSANAFTNSADAAMFIDSIVNTASRNTGLFYSQGLLFQDDLNNAGTYRQFFTSGITGESVTDGMVINFDVDGTSVVPNLVQ